MRTRTIAVFVGQSYLNYTPNETYNSVLFTSAYEKHFVRKSVQIAKDIFKFDNPRKYIQETDCN